MPGLSGLQFPAEADPLGRALLVVTSEEEPHRETLWLAGLDGSAPRQLGKPSTMVRNPAWSPDGQWLVVESDQLSFRDLYRIERATGAETRLTDARHGSFEPDVAADGMIVFVSSRDGNAELYAMGPTGDTPIRLTHHPGNDTNPAWSPDGRWVAWLAWRGESVQVHLIQRGQSEGRVLRADPHPAELDRGLAWSPKGDRLAITTQVGPKDVAVDIVALSGERIARLDGPGPDEFPAWSPDGAHLVFASSREGQPDLYVVGEDGSGIRPLVHGPLPEWLPRWGG